MENDTTRIWFFDNMKAVLIFFVVLGHVIEAGRIPFLYQFIYLFHIPLFVFCSGYLAKYNPKKILTDMIYPYIVFQTLYFVFERVFLGKNTAIGFTRPVWIMWYMFALIAWSLVLPLIEVSIKSIKGIAITICMTLAMGIVVGFDAKIGYYLSLSRIIYFLPFFVIGVCLKNTITAKKYLDTMSKWYVKCISGVLSLGILIWLYLFHGKIVANWLYGSYAYAESFGEGGYNATTRMLIYLCTFIISIFIISIMPRRKTFFSYIGQRCMQVYLLHAFIIRIFEKSKILSKLAGGKMMFGLVAVVISIAIVFLFSLRIWGKIFAPLFSFPFHINSRKERMKG